MKRLVLALFFLISAQTQALTWEIIGACSKTPVISGEYSIENMHNTVGETTLAIFTQNNIPFQGNRDGMNTINNSPVGLDAMEVLSDERMRAHGWCFMVNGEIPDSYASQVNFESNDDHLTWYYCYATLIRNDWTSFYNATYEVRPNQFCK